MSRLGLVICSVLLGIASLAIAQEPYNTYSTYNNGVPDPYAGPPPSGMRFGDVAHVITRETGDVEEGYVGNGGCPNCLFGVKAPPCDPAWSGPCIDWKLIGWYSSFHDHHGGGCGDGCGLSCRLRCRAGCRACRTDCCN